MVMSRDQNAATDHYIKAGNKSSETVDQFQYLGTNNDHNSIPKEIKSGLKLGNACYHLVQYLLSFSFLTKK
jgi:hypothetical protein